MQKDAQLNIRIDVKIKEKAEAIFKKIGISPAVAIRLFYARVCLEKGIPFALKTEPTPKKKAKKSSK